MEPLYDRTGHVYAWLDEAGKVYGPDGKNLAFIESSSVYKWDGQHVGWWQDGQIRDRFGCVVLFTAKVKNLGVVRPALVVRPVRPVRETAPATPLKSPKPAKPLKRMAWAREIPF